MALKVIYEVKNVSKTYGAVVALDGASLKLHAGEVVGLDAVVDALARQDEAEGVEQVGLPLAVAAEDADFLTARDAAGAHGICPRCRH